jgi:chorismate mutase
VSIAEPLAVRAIRGATTVDADTPEQIIERVQALIAEVFDRNGLTAADAISLFITATADIRTYHPATAARHWGLGDVAIIGAQELDIAGGLPLCIRTLLHVSTSIPRSAIQHVFLEGAVVLRPDLVDERLAGK